MQSDNMNEASVHKQSLKLIQYLKRITKDDNLHLIMPSLIRVILRSNFQDQSEEADFKI